MPARETPELMPAPIYYAHAILHSLAEARHAGAAPLLGPDAKSQVTLQYVDGKPVRRDLGGGLDPAFRPSIDQDEVREIVRPHVLNVLPEGWMCDEEHFYVNPTGRFVIGGPDGDCGLTGRKIIVDTYGGAAPHGGGAFSGKDPTKVDRSAAYAARYLAKNVVAAGLAERCTIQVAYAIGVAKPLSVYVDTDGTATVDEDKLSRVLQELMDLSPRGIRTHLGLNKPIYAPHLRLRPFRPRRPSRMAASPGSGSTSSTSCAAHSERAPTRRSDPGRASTAAAAGGRCARASALDGEPAAAARGHPAASRAARPANAVSVAAGGGLARDRLWRRRASRRAGRAPPRDRLHRLRGVRERRRPLLGEIAAPRPRQHPRLRR